MRVVLFRHAPAETRDPDLWPDDAERPLTSRGAKRAKRVAAGIRALEPALVRVLSSPAVRARETALALTAAIGEDARLETLAPLGPDGSWRQHLGVLMSLAEEDPAATIALVGHEPDLGKLAGALLFGAPTPMPLKKAGACAIGLDHPAVGAGTLLWWCPPRALRALARRRRGS